MVVKVFSAALLLAGVVMIAHSAYLIKKKKDPFTERILAEFVDCIPPIQSQRDFVRLKLRLRFKYSYNGREYVGDSILGTDLARNYRQGSKYEIYINPSKPGRVAISKNDWSLITAGELFLCILVMIIGMISMLS